jgi:hypothetical protein
MRTPSRLDRMIAFAAIWAVLWIVLIVITWMTG